MGGARAIPEPEDVGCDLCADVSAVAYRAGAPAPPPFCGTCGRRLRHLVVRVAPRPREARRPDGHR